MSTSFDRPPKNKSVVPWQPLALIVAPASKITKINPLLIVVGVAASTALAAPEISNVHASIQSIVAPPVRVVPQAPQPVATDAGKELAELRARLATLEQQNATARSANLPAIIPPAPTPAPVRLDDGGSRGGLSPPPPPPPTGAENGEKQVVPPPKLTPQKPVAHSAPESPSMAKAKADEATGGAHRTIKPASHTPQPRRQTVHDQPAPAQQPARRVVVYPTYQQQQSFIPFPLPLPFFGGHRVGIGGMFRHFGGGFHR
jgi:hypothetical protein